MFDVGRGTGFIPAVETAGYKMADVIGAFFLSQEQRLKNDFFHIQGSRFAETLFDEIGNCS
ncbi:MAG: hypothetical protein D6816_05180 [Bacteroidetes bacterium]|nr:MAG: hypothetical protein D6816_05180 [Bacteroidota bacterium]